METVVRDRLFAGMAENRILSMRPAELLVSLKRLGLRTKLGDTKVPLDATLGGNGGMTAEQVLLQLRRQFDNLFKLCSEAALRRLRYFFQFQLIPCSARQLMPGYGMMAFLPGQRQRAFPSGARFWDLDQLEVIALGTRLHRLVAREGAKPFSIDHFDIRVLYPEVDRKNGKVTVGGAGQDEEGKTYVRCGLSRMMDFEPGRDPWAVPRDCPEITDWAIDLHAALEMGLATGSDEQLEPTFPSLYLGFEHADDVGPEVTPQLQYAALGSIRDWLYLGKPTAAPFDWASSFLSEFSGVNPDALTSWNDVERLLGGKRVEHVLNATWANSEVAHDGLTLVPASLFGADSPQKPFEKAKRVLADMSSHLGRLTTRPNGREIIEHGMSRIQMIKLDVPEVMPQGRMGAWEFDLASTEVGMEHEFA